MTDQKADRGETARILEQWSAYLIDELGLEGTTVDVDAVLALAGVAAHSIVRPAAPLTTYLVGYAAGLAAAGGDTDGEAARAAFARATESARGYSATGS